MEQIEIKMKLTQLQGDMGQYRQQSILLEPIDVLVSVKVDADPKYFSNPEVRQYKQDCNIASATGNGGIPKLELEFLPTLTLEGVKFIRDTIQNTLTEDVSLEDDWDENEDYSEDW